MTRFLIVVLIVLPGCSVSPSSPIADAFFSRAPLTSTVESMAQGERARTVFIEALQARAYGEVIGYKAGLTSQAAQATFGATEPVLGVLLKGMVSYKDTVFNAAFGTQPRFEGDLLVRVADTAINTAETDTELAAALDAVIPFLELPDLMYDDSVNLTGAALTTINVGARAGVAGTPIVLPTRTNTLAMLAAIDLVLVANGDTLATSSSVSLLGHPINVIRWIRDQVLAEGERLEAGHLLSLGSMTPLFVPEKEQSISAVYTIDGLATTVTVAFE